MVAFVRSQRVERRSRQFDTRAEQSFWATEASRALDETELRALNCDIRWWVPGLPEVFRGKTVLDLGAGCAPLGTLLARQYEPSLVVSTDVGPDRLRSAVGYMQRYRLGLVCGDAFRLPFRDASFDYIVANSVLHHLPNLVAATAEIARVLKPGGWYFGREPNFNNLVVRTAVFHFSGTWIRKGAKITKNEYPLRAQEILSAFTVVGCSCEMHYFWRRLRQLRHPLLSFAISVRAQRV